MDLSRNLDVGFGGQSETPPLSDAVTQQGNVPLEPLGVTGEAQDLSSRLSQGRGLVFGAPREARPQEVGDSRIAALLPALKKGEEGQGRLRTGRRKSQKGGKNENKKKEWSL